MPRLFSIVLLLAAMPAWAQFRGMSRPSAGIGSHGFAGRFVAGPARMGTPMAPARFAAGRGGGITIITRPGPGFFPRTSTPFVHPFFPKFGRFGHACAFNRFGCAGFGFSPFFGFGGFGTFGAFGWPFLGGWGAGYPYYDSGYFGDYNTSSQLQATLAQQQQLTSDLEDQLRKERLRRLEAEHDAEPSPPPQRSTQPSQERPSPPTILVFRDGSRTEIQNYVIADNTIYQFAEHWSKKISLSDIDIPATVKANDARGVEFSVPTKRATVQQ